MEACQGVGRYQTQPLDTASRKSIRILPPADFPASVAESMGTAPAGLIIQDFYHAGEFWFGLLDLDSVREVYGQAFNFSRPRVRKNKNGYEIVYGHDGLPKRTLGILNHVQSRFVLDSSRPLRLYRSLEDVGAEAVHCIDDLVYTIEAVGPAGIKFNFRDAYGGHLVCAHRFVSTEEMVFERIVLEGQYVTESPPLDLTPQEKQQLLERSLKRSDIAGMNEPYFLCRVCGTNNCTSNPFQILDDVVNYTTVERIAAWIYRLPINPRLYLRLRGLDSDPMQRKLVRDEFEEFINQPETRQRKRAFLKQRKAERKRKREA